MATNPSIDSHGALAIKPPRENIFARPRSTMSPASTAGPFDPAAACAPAEHSAPRLTPVRRPGVRWAAKVTSLLVVPLLVFAVARPGGDGSPVQERPLSPQMTPPVKRTTAAPPTRRVAPTRGANRNGHRTVRSPDTRRAAPRSEPSPPVLPAVPAAPRPAPAPPALRRPLPAPVPAGSPPEFM